MKRMICILLTVLFLLCGCTEQAAPDKKQETQKIPALPSLQGYDFYAGFGRMNITPEEPVPLGGYGAAENRISRAILDELYVTGIALTDKQGQTVLLLNWDGVRSYNEVQAAARNRISQETGVAIENIYIGCTHSHSCPEMTNNKVESAGRYAELVVERTTACAVNAMADRKPAKMHVGSIEAEGLNFVRHYSVTDRNGVMSYFGDNFGTAIFNDSTNHTTQADPTMYMLLFERASAENIAFINWRAHPHFTGGSNLYNLSADWVGTFRDAFERQTGVNFLYFQGASGNINEKSRIFDENITVDYAQYGAILADYAIELMEQVTYEKVETIATEQNMLEATVNHNEDGRYYQAKEFQTLWNAGADQAMCEELGRQYGIRSIYHANAIITNFNRSQTQQLELNAIKLGNVAMVTAPNELFDTNSVWLEENAPTAYTLTLGYTNGHYGYVPSKLAWEYSCYESDITYYTAGTAEQIQQTFLDMLGKM